MISITPFLGTWQVQIIIILIAVDVVLGIISALLKKEFDWKKLANFMKGPVLGYVFGFVVLQAAIQSLGTLYFVVKAAFVLIVLTLLASIFRNLSKLGIPVPDSLKK
jgi:phage-related holin